MSDRAHAPKDQNLIEIPSLAPASGSPYVTSGVSDTELDAEGAFLDRMASDTEALNAALARGNGFLRDAVLAAGKTHSNHLIDDGAGMVCEGVSLSAALAGVRAEVEDAYRMISDHDGGYTDEWAAAQEGLTPLTEGFRLPANSLLANLDENLGTDFANDLNGTAEERVDAAIDGTYMRMVRADVLMARCEDLSHAHGEGAVQAALELRDIVGELDDTPEYFADRVGASQASAKVKALFAYAVGAETSPWYGDHSDELGECILNEVGERQLADDMERFQLTEGLRARAALGNLKEPFDGGLSKYAGRMTEMLFPLDGDSGQLELSFDWTPIVTPLGRAGVTLDLTTEVENDGGQYKTETKLGVGVIGKGNGPLQLEVALKAVGMVATGGDSGAEAWDLVAFGIKQGLLQQGCDWDFDQEKIGSTLAAMDGDDFAEVGLGASLEAEGGDGAAVLSAERISGLRFTRGEDGSADVSAFEEGTYSAEFEWEYGRFAAEFKRRELSEGRAPGSWELEVHGGAAIRADELEELLGTKGGFAVGAVDVAASALLEFLGAAGDKKTAETAANELRLLGRGAGLDRKLLAGLDRPELEDLKPAGERTKEAEQSLEIGLTIQGSGGVTGVELTLEQKDSLTRGADTGVIAAEMGLERKRNLVKLKLM